VGYVKKNFLHGIELTDFSTIQAAAQVWLDTIANLRIHGETQQRPIDLFAQEREHLRPLSPHPYDIAHTATCAASHQCTQHLLGEVPVNAPSCRDRRATGRRSRNELQENIGVSCKPADR